MGRCDAIPGNAERSGAKGARLAALAISLLLFPLAAHAVNYFSRLAGPTGWSATGAWSTAGCGGASAGTAEPGGGAGDTATICNGHIITLNVTEPNALTSVTIQNTGTLRIGSLVARTLTTGTLTNDGTLTYNTNQNHVINVTGALTNNDLITVNNAAVTTATPTLTVGGLLTNSGTLRFAGNGGVLTVNANGGITNSGTIDVNTASNVTHFLNVGGNLTNNGTVQFAPDGTSFVNVTFNGSGTQTIGGAGATTNFNCLTVNPSGASIANIVDVTANPFTFDSLNVSTTEGLNLVDGTFRVSSAITVAPLDNGQACNGVFAGASVGYAIPANARIWVAGGTVNYTTPNENLTINSGGELRASGGTFNVGSANNVRVRPDNGSSEVIEGGTVNVAGRFTCLTAPPGGNSNTVTVSDGTLTVGTVGNTSATFSPFCIGTAGTFNMSGGTIIVRQGATAGTPLGYTNLAGTFSVIGGTVQIGDAGTPAGDVIEVNSSAPVWDFVVGSANATARLDTNNLTVLDDVTISAGTLDANSNDLDITVGAGNNTGNWTNNGSFDAGSATVTFTGTSATQAIGGTSATTFNNLTINKASNNLTISTSPTVDGTLTFTNGKIVTGANLVTISTTGSSSAGSTASHLVGNLRKNFPAAGAFTYAIGDGTNYTPLAVSFTAMPTTGGLTATTPTSAADHPDTTGGTSTVDSAKSVSRYWTLKNSTLAGTYDVTLNYISGTPVDLDAGVTVGNFVIARGTSCSGAGALRTCGTWSRPTLSGTPTSTQASATGISVASGDPEADFAVGEPASTKFTRERQFIYTRELY